MSRSEPWPHRHASLADIDTAHDLKAGWSTICRAGNHRTCAQLQARCECDCHGRHGQEPPTPRPQERPVMSEATVTPLPSKPVAVPSLADHTCGTCGKVCASPNGVLIHQARAHAHPRPAKAATTTPPPMAERSRVEVPADRPLPAAPNPEPTAVKAARAAAPKEAPKHEEHQAVADRDLLNVLAVAYHDLNGADVGCAIDSAATLIDALAANGWIVVAAT